jgi:GLPGLI family protein
MKKIIMVAPAIFLAYLLQAQLKEGKVTYERTIQMQIRFADNSHEEQMLPKTRSDKFELSFGGNQSLWKHAPEEISNDEFSGNGMQIRMVGPGQDDIVYCNFSSGRKVEQREMFGKKFIITDSLGKLNWKLTGETQTILGYTCQKAVTQRFGKRTTMNIENGNFERKEVDDTSGIVAWFTTDIPVAAGPEIPGQLPGFILAMDINNGRMVYKAVEIFPTTDLGAIREPVKGKKVSPKAFREETRQMMEEMQRNNQGGNRMIRIGD